MPTDVDVQTATSGTSIYGYVINLKQSADRRWYMQKEPRLNSTNAIQLPKERLLVNFVECEEPVPLNTVMRRSWNFRCADWTRFFELVEESPVRGEAK